MTWWLDKEVDAAMQRLCDRASPERVRVRTASLCKDPELSDEDRFVLGASLMATSLVRMFLPGWHRLRMFAGGCKLVGNMLTEADRSWGAAPAGTVPMPERR